MIDTPPGSPSNPSECPGTFRPAKALGSIDVFGMGSYCGSCNRRLSPRWAQGPAPTNNVASAASEWEYLDQADNDLRVTGGLRQRGQEKWELVTVKGEKALTYYFKRPKSAQNPQTARVVFAGNRWSGRIDANLAKQPCPAIKGPRSLAAFWHAFKQPGEPPPVDFSRDLVFAATTAGSHIDIVPVLYHDGNLSLSLTFGGTNPQPQDGAFILVTVPREFTDNDGPHVIKSINGAPVTAPGPEDQER